VSENAKQTAPARVLGGLAAFSIVAGSMLGVGIFLFPGQIALGVGSSTAFLLLWLVGGAMALSGAVACGELGAMLPRAGGDYVFQREAFGASLAFASGWVLFAAVFCGSIASLAVAVFQYQLSALSGLALGEWIGPLGLTATQLLAGASIVAVTALNAAGARPSARLQTAATLIPISALTVIAVSALLFAAPEAPAIAAAAGASDAGTAGLTKGFLFVYFAYAGWPNIIYVAGEVRDPGVNIPRSMLLAVGAVTGLYLLLCSSFLQVLGLGGLAALGREWIDAGTGLARALGSEPLEKAILVAIAIAIVTSINATILGGSRVAYAMAADGAFWSGAAALDRRGVPARALWLQCGLALVYVATGTFDAIIEMTSLAMLVTGGLTVASLFVLRRSQPDAARPYRAAGYPWLPAFYLVLVAVVFATKAQSAAASDEPAASLPFVGLAILALAYAAHRIRLVVKKG
jgi:APA family basic amino acid/polyamine antiporter